MSAFIVFTFIGEDKPGLIERLSNTVSQHGGNWLESRMSQMAGHFAGIARIQASSAAADNLRNALNAISGDDLTISIHPEGSREKNSNIKNVQLNLIGNDRQGIVKELTSALAALHVNVIEMNTNVTSAPMTADPLFEASAAIQIPATVDISDLSDRLDEIANQLDVDISLDD